MFDSYVDQAFETSLATGNPYAIAATGGAKVANLLLPEIGRGRKEADEITAVQSQLDALLTAINDEYPQASIDRCYQLESSLQEQWTRFKQWIQSQAWNDGRAAAQAIDPSKDPSITVELTLRNIRARIGAGAPMTPVTPGAASSTSDNTQTLLYAGGFAVMAKLLGFL